MTKYLEIISRTTKCNSILESHTKHESNVLQGRSNPYQKILENRIPYCKVFLGITYQKIRQSITRDYDVQHFQRSIYTMRRALKGITSLCFDTVSWDRLTESCEKVQPAKWKCRSRYSSAPLERWVRFTTVACAKRVVS